MTESTPEITIVVPITRKEAEPSEVVAALGAELDRLGRSWECILVYDGIGGAVWQHGLALQEATSDQVRTIALHRSFGESVCLSSAFEHARGSLILTSPQYVQVDPHALKSMLERIDQGAEFVTSWRDPRIDSWPNRMLSKAFNALMRRIVGTKFNDLNCTLRVIRRELLDHLTIYGDMYRYLPAIAWRQGFRVEEVKVRHLREQGGAVFGPAVYARRALDVLGVTFLTRFTHKPLRFFGALGGLLMALGTLISGGLFVLYLFNQIAGLYQRPLFLIGVILFVLGVQVVGFGLVGEIIIFTQARNVREYRLERVDS
ncbi:MAG: hypothetical protein ACI841_001716 [Planctomycetota bacterium]|jgi:hypothetical protein